MGRPSGRRSEDYAEKRDALAHAIYLALIQDAQLSFAGMADAAGVSRPTLQHYFGDRAGAVRAALASASRVGARFYDQIAGMPVQDPEHTLVLLLVLTIAGWRDVGVGNLHHVGIQAGLADIATGQSYLQEILDPLVDATARLLARMNEAGTLRHPTPRVGALQLLGPVVVALLHQRGLGGAACNPLPEETVAREVALGFVRAYGVPR